MTTTKNAYPTTLHADGDVTLWDVYAQQWVRLPADMISDAVLASLPADEREAIARHAEEVRS